ncbi:MAG: preprotein translocase subunit SecG [Alphaproteobacteria bacterium]|nr:preprotein translocase subunit SecG [Alphaproteobacteria bacterium]MBU1755498.1 preprotein translocase subunit SecG [Alphaproteobacteria bacterium]
MFLFLTIIQAIVAAALVGVILMQRSEGGGLGIGGSPTGMLSARGAADFLTRSTRWLAVAFVALSIALAAVAASSGGADTLETTLDRDVAPIERNDPLGSDPLGGSPLGGAAAPAEPATAPASDPLAQ